MNNGNEKQSSADQPLELLARMSELFAESQDVQKIIHEALELVVRYVGAEGGALFLLDPDEKTVTCKACVGPADIIGIQLDINQGIVGLCVRHNSGKIVTDVENSPYFNDQVDSTSGFQTRSVLCAPMTVNNQRLGAIELVNKHNQHDNFNSSDLLMLQTLASSVALAIVNARMSVELMQQERVKRELELAAEIQRRLLPSGQLRDFPIYGINVPARSVSGDFFDFFKASDGQIMFCIGDVSGKGINAALLMSKAASLFRCLGKTITDPTALVKLINTELCETATHGMFVTMIAGRLDPRDGQITLVNAGHEPAVLLRGEELEYVGADLPPLGVAEYVTDNLEAQRVDLSNASLFLFTDGLTESRGSDGAPLGVTGLEALIKSTPRPSAPLHVNRIITQILARTPTPHDDLTLLSLALPGL